MGRLGRDYSFELLGSRYHCKALEEFRLRRDEYDDYAAFLAERGR